MSVASNSKARAAACFESVSGYIELPPVGPAAKRYRKGTPGKVALFHAETSTAGTGWSDRDRPGAVYRSDSLD